MTAAGLLNRDQLYDRRVVLVVGKNTSDPTAPFIEALRFSDLRVTFKVEKTDDKNPNTADIAVYNLSATSRAALEGKGTPVLLMAGYASGVAQVFSGHARVTDSEKQGVDWATRIRCGDGERAIAFATVSESAKPGTQVKDMVLRVAKKLVSDPSNIAQTLQNEVRSFSSGYAAHGNAAAELTRLCDKIDLKWSIQDGRLELLTLNGFTNDVGPLFTPDSGLVGTPALGTPDAKGGPQTWKVKTLLEPRIRPGQRFFVERTISTDGQPVKRETFRAKKVHHTGDTHGGEFFTEIEATQV